MRTIKFRPLRLVKKTGKITIASYIQWRKVKTADYNQFQLIVMDDYKKFRPDDLVYDHEGNELFFFAYNPSELPVFNYTHVDGLFDLDAIREENKQFGIRWSSGYGVNYSAKGMDCSGVPTFSHYTANHIANNYKDMSQFEPLTVKIVTYWFGWFLYQLDKSRLQIGTATK